MPCLKIDPNSCFSDFSDSVNSMKVLLHLGKTRLSLAVRRRSRQEESQLGLAVKSTQKEAFGR